MSLAIGSPLLKAEGLHKAFGSVSVLRGVDLDVVSGEILAVMGPSGSGKSTLLHCLAGILIPDAGAVYYEGRRVSNLPDTERSALRRGEFGFVFQFGQLVAELTAEENVALPLLLGRSAKRRAALSQARTWLKRFDLADAERRRPGELSGGEAQRVAVARAMIQHPRVVFADEPTGSLDSVAGQEVLTVLTSAASDEGASVVLVTHDSRVAAQADRIIMMEDGSTVDAGRPAAQPTTDAAGSQRPSRPVAPPLGMPTDGEITR